MSKDVRAGKAYIEMYLRDDKLKQGLRSSQRALSRVKLGVAAVGTAFTAMAGIASGVAVVALKKATDAAGDFAEAVSKFDTVFGDMSPDVKQWGEELASQLGIARREVFATLSGFQDLFVPLGIDSGGASEMSKTLTQLAVDLGSFNNLATADVVRDLQSAMTGSSETMKKYGVIVDQAAVKQRLLNMEIDPSKASNAEKAQARLQLIMESTTAAQGDALRTADSYNNQMKRFGASVEEASVKIGEKFLPAMADLMVIVNAAVQDLTKWAERVIPAIQGIEDAALRAAQSGNWEKVGEVIGLQLEIGLRNQFGDPLISLLKTGLKTTSGLGLLATPQGQFAGDVATDFSSRGFELRRRLLSPEFDLFSGDLGNRSSSKVQALEKELARIRETSEAQLKLEQRSLEAIEKLKGLGFE